MKEKILWIKHHKLCLFLVVLLLVFVIFGIDYEHFGKKFCSYDDMGGLCSGQKCIEQGKWIDLDKNCLSFAVD